LQLRWARHEAWVSTMSARKGRHGYHPEEKE
jgi:hypothetical protein